MSGTRKRRGTTLVELSLVIAILAMVALPFAAFVSQNLKNTVQSSTQLKEQMVLEQVMQDMEEHLRSATRTPPMDNPPIPNKVVFASRDPQPDPQPASNPPLQPAVVTTHSYTYEYRADKLLFYKNDTVFPDGLEANMITGLTFPTWSLDPTDPPCYITVRIEAHDTSLQRTIYLRNYTSIVGIAAILGVMPPVPGATPTPTIADTTECTATISWTATLTGLPAPATFAPGTPYTATITLTPIAGYTLTGVTANFFTVDWPTGHATNAANSGVVTATFPAIGATQLAIAGTALTLSKAYDGNTTAAVTAGDLIGVVGSEDVTVTAVATYDTAAVGAGKTITVVYTLGGADAGNYVKPENYTETGTITAKAITVTATGPTKVYGTALTTGISATNFTAGATGVGSEVITSVTLTPDAAGLSATTAARAAYVVTPSLATGSGGFLASNYLVTYVAYNGTVSAKPLTIAAPTLTLSKAYDGNTTATVTAVGTLSGVAGGDTVTVSAVATYDTAAVGAGKTITVVYTLGGADAAKYVKPVNYTVSTGVITTKQLTITGTTLTLSKPYDGNTTATVTAGALSGVVSPDVVTVSAVATYDTAAVGAGKPITVVYTLGGADAAKYVKPVNYTVSTGVITRKLLMITAPNLTTSKPYDGTTTAAVTAGVLVGKVGSEDVTVTAVATYDTAAVGAGKPITVVYTLGGAQAGNYIKPVNYTVATGVITLAPINMAAILGVTVPVQGATPVTTITATTQYTGTVTWTPAIPGGDKFKNKTVYTATITLTANIGFTFAGVGVNFFTVYGATSVTNPAGSGTIIVVTAIFSTT